MPNEPGTEKGSKGGNLKKQKLAMQRGQCQTGAQSLNERKRSENTEKDLMKRLL